MKKIVVILCFVFSLLGYSFDVVVTDYYDSTFGDFIPASSDTLDYSAGCFYIVSSLGNVLSGDEVSVEITYPDGEKFVYSENCNLDGEAVFYKRIDFKGTGIYNVKLTFNGQTSSASFQVVPDTSEDPFEPNNYRNNQFFLERGTILSSLISGEDIDYFQLKVDTSLNIELSLQSEADLCLEVYGGDTLISSSDIDFEGDESMNLSLQKGVYTVKVYSPVKETGDYSLTVKGSFPVYLSLTDFGRGFEKNVVISNLSDFEGDAELHWYDENGQELLNTVEHFAPYETKEFDGGNYSFLEIYPEDIEVNASVYGKNAEGNEAVAYEGKLLDIEKTIVSHIATQTYLYETIADFSFVEGASFLNYANDTLKEDILQGSSFMVNFNDFYNDDITSPWGIARSDGDFIGIEMFRLIGGDYFQATALTLTPQVARVFYLPHIDVRYFWWTGISIVNPNNSDADVNLIALDSSGNSVAEAGIVIEANGKSVGIVSDYFKEGLPENAVAMKIVSDLPVQGLYLFGTKRGEEVTEDIFGGLNSSAIYSKKLYFSLMPSGEDKWTGIGIFNPNNQSVTVTLKGLDVSGNLVEEKTVELTPLQKYVSLGKDIFDSDEIYRMIAVSDKPLCGFYLFGDKNHTYLYGLEAMR